jgi:hypothetical protein
VNPSSEPLAKERPDSFVRHIGRSGEAVWAFFLRTFLIEVLCSQQDKP